jgi:hypothetical protein
MPKRVHLKGEERRGWDAYRHQRKAAAKRGIPFLFEFEGWWAWWQRDGLWDRRGRRRDQWVMARFGDRGAYEPGNVYATTQSGNARFSHPQLALDL